MDIEVDENQRSHWLMCVDKMACRTKMAVDKSRAKE